MARGQVKFIIEDIYTRNWLQGVVKSEGLVFDNSFNSEIIEIEALSLCNILEIIYGKEQVLQLRKKIEQTDSNADKVAISGKELFKEFILGATKTFGEIAIPLLQSYLVTGF